MAIESVKITDLTQAQKIDATSLFLLTNAKTSNKLAYNQLCALLNNDITQGVSITDINSKLTIVDNVVTQHIGEITDLQTTTEYHTKKIDGLCTAVDTVSVNVFVSENCLSSRIYNNESSINNITTIIGTTAITGTITDNITALNSFATTAASDNKLGPIKVGYIQPESGTTYPIQLDKDGNAYVNVPNSVSGGVTDRRINTLADVSSYYVGIQTIGTTKTPYSIPLSNSENILALQKYISGDNDCLCNVISNINDRVLSNDEWIYNATKFDDEEILTGGFVYDMLLSTNGISTYTTNLALSTAYISAEVKTIKESIFEFKEYSTTEQTIHAKDVLTVRIPSIKLDNSTPISITKISTSGSNSEKIAINSRWIDNNETRSILQACFAVENVGIADANITIKATILYLKIT